MSLSVTYLASSARATMPAASGAEAEVPVCLSVQRWCRSVVTWGDRGVSSLIPKELPGVGHLQHILLLGPSELFELYTERTGTSPARAGICVCPSAAAGAELL